MHEVAQVHEVPILERLQARRVGVSDHDHLAVGPELRLRPVLLQS